jgi:2-furoyl-CoA dehydrogenase FAD binding subunit
MKPSAFDYVRADTIDEALSVLGNDEQDSKVLAGGQSLLPMLNMRLARPTLLLDINRLAELDTLDVTRRDGGQEQLLIGALTRQRALERYAGQRHQLRILHAALLDIGHPQTRNRGTVGGSLVHADASAELPLLFVTLGGEIMLRSTRGERRVPVQEFFLSHYTTAIEPDELLISSAWNIPAAHEGIAFKEFRRRHGDFALMATACTIALDKQQHVQKIRLGIGGLTEAPILVEEAQSLIGERWTGEQGRAIAETVVGHLQFENDAQASAVYRRQLAIVMIARILEAAYNDALQKEVVHV